MEQPTEDLQKLGEQVEDAWKAFATHADTKPKGTWPKLPHAPKPDPVGCPPCDAVAAYWRRPGRQSDVWTLAEHHQQLCEVGRPLFEAWRYAIDQLVGRRPRLLKVLEDQPS